MVASGRGFVAAQQLPQPIVPPQVDAELYPLGWSRDGKFAYVWVNEPPFRGGYGFRYAVLDAVTDRELWWHYDHTDQYGWDGTASPVRLSWDQNAMSVSERLTALGIETTDGVRLENFPLVRGSERYTVEVDEWHVDPDTSPYRNGVVGYTLTIHSSERGSKLVARRGRIFATSITVQGYIRSPYENRIVVLVAESGNAYQETTFTDVTLVGAHLDVGFE